MTDTLSNVQQFHEVFNCPIGNSPKVPDSKHKLVLRQIQGHLMDLRALARTVAKEDVNCQRMALAIEELSELAEALHEGNTVKALDALADLDYINMGTVVTLGLKDVFYEACERVHQSNLSKLEDGKPVYDETGKVRKGKDYKPVDLTDLVDGTWLASQNKND